MTILYLLIPLSLMMVIIAIIAFRWAIKNRQFDDLDAPSMIPLLDDERERQHKATTADSNTGNIIDPQTLTDEIRAYAQSGFFPIDRVLDILLVEENYEPKQDIRQLVQQEYAKLEQEKKSWPAETDCDKLTAAFNEMNDNGIIALECAGFTQSDGYENCMYLLEQSENSQRYIGYCFYHEQDLMRAITNQELCLAFGPSNPALEPTEGPRVGKIITNILKKYGFETRWDGSFNKRICIPQIDWKRR